MEEDEEVVLKNSGLYTCLVEAGFHNFESIEKTELKCSSTESVESLKSQPANGKYNSNVEEHRNYIESCLRSKLVFADDASFVEHYMTSLSVPPGFLIFSTLKVISCSAVGIYLYSCRFLRANVTPILFWSLNVTPLAIYGISFSYHKYQKFRRERVINCLLSTLKELSLFVQKSVQFVLNRSVLSFISDQSHVNYEENTQLQEVLFTTLRMTILELKSATVSLVKEYPLKEAVEMHQYYLAFLPNEDLNCDHPKEIISAEYLQKMKYSYFLLQSEFLRRLCLCLIPTLQNYFSEASVLQLFERLTATTNVCSQLCQRLKSHFETHYLFEKRSHESRIRENNTNWAYREAYVKVCSLSLNLQSVLRESRRLEQLLEDVDLRDAHYDRIVTSLDVGAQRIDIEYGKCHAALDDFRKYVFSLHPKRDQELPVTTRSSPSMPEASKTNIVVGKSDFRPQWPDEVFVGVSSVGDVQSAELNNVESEVVGNPCAKLLISELKIALRDKAEEWKKREKEALKNKDVDEESETEEEPIIEEIAAESRRRRSPPTIVVPPVSQDSSHLTESSLAKQIAAASVSWQMREEQHFSFGDDDSDDEDTEGCD